MSVLSIQQALEKALQDMLPKITSIGEGQDWNPGDAPQQQFHLLPVEPENPTIGGDFTRERGFLQVNLRYPDGAGKKAAAERAELIKGIFKRGASFVKDGITVHIERTPQVGPGFPDGSRYILPVRIRYYSNI